MEIRLLISSCRCKPITILSFVRKFYPHAFLYDKILIILTKIFQAEYTSNYIKFPKN